MLVEPIDDIPTCPSTVGQDLDVEIEITSLTNYIKDLEFEITSLTQEIKALQTKLNIKPSDTNCCLAYKKVVNSFHKLLDDILPF